MFFLIQAMSKSHTHTNIQCNTYTHIPTTLSLAISLFWCRLFGEVIHLITPTMRLSLCWCCCLLLLAAPASSQQPDAPSFDLYKAPNGTLVLTSDLLLAGHLARTKRLRVSPCRVHGTTGTALGHWLQLVFSFSRSVRVARLKGLIYTVEKESTVSVSE